MTHDNIQKGNTMTEYTAGDLVEAVKGETLTRGRLWKGDNLFWLGASGRTVSRFLEDGFTITVIEKAAPVVVLPTEQGAYRDAIGNYWNLSGAGVWYGFYGESKGVLENPPLRRLEPVSETAKKVLDRVRTTAGIGLNLHEDLKVIAGQFGVEL